MKAILNFFLSNRWLVLIAMVLLVAGGVYVLVNIPLEAFPDLTNNQVVVSAKAPGMSPVEVEQLVTFPMETAMLGLPHLQTLRSTSKLELTMLTIIFDDSIDQYRARQLVAERLNQVQAGLPPGISAVMGPMSTAFGEVYQFTVQSPHMSLMQLKTLLDWTIRYKLVTIPEVSEINSWGGETKQYSVLVDPDQLRRYNLTLHDVIMAIENNNANFGGSYIEHAEQTYAIRGLGRAESLGDLGNIVVATHNGVPILVNQVAKLELLPLIRHGAILHDGEGETVSGEVIILRGANGNKIIQEVKQKIAAMHLPDGAKIIPFYDQSNVINASIHTVEDNLLEAAVLVIVILLVFLGNWRAALIVACTIPFSLMFAFVGMATFGISANLMSLGAIDFGTIVDGSVIMVENCMHRLENGEDDEQEHPGGENHDRENHDEDGAGKNEPGVLDVVRRSSLEVARPIIFGVLIILAVYLPVLTLQDLPGRMFRPMAVTVMSALVGSLIMALFVVPTLCSVALRRNGEGSDRRAAKEDRLARFRRRLANFAPVAAFHRLGQRIEQHLPWHKNGRKGGWFPWLRDHYSSSLDRADHHRKLVVGIAATLVVLAVGSIFFIGTEFMPTLDEGSLVITSKKMPGISLSQSIKIQEEIDHIIRSFPEVSTVVAKMGRPDLATEDMGVYETDAYINFKPRKTWRKCCDTKTKLADALQTELEKIPGVSYEFTQPMEMRMDETIAGARGDLALKIFGNDLGTLERLGNQAHGILSGIQGASEPQLERISGAANLEIKINRPEAARYGLGVSDIQEVVESLLGSRQISEMVQGEERFPIAVRLPSAIRNNLDDIYGLQLKTPTGEFVRLDQVTDIHRVGGPILINREDAQRRVLVSTNVKGRDLGSFVKEAQQKVAQQLPLPPGYTLQWGGQYQNEQVAEARLVIALPLSLLLICGLLYATFQNLRQMFLILLIVPLALVGGIAALWLRGINLNLSACIGFIALFGVAVLDGIVMTDHINNLREKGFDMAKAVRQGASDRLRPVLITATVASLGFIPMALATSRGAEVQRPLATVVIGGLITATLLTLYVLPVLYPPFSRHLKLGPDNGQPGKPEAVHEHQPEEVHA
jgi:cobalt-zinc-cadmium resistance protein CzcA